MVDSPKGPGDAPRELPKDWVNWEADTPIAAPAPADAPPGEHGAPKAKHLACEMKEGRRFFSLGPLYETMKIPFDLLATYLAETRLRPKDVGLLDHHFSAPVYPDLQGNTHVLQSLPTDQFLAFDRWIRAAVFRRPEGHWHVRGISTSLVDPDYPGVDVLLGLLFVTTYLPFSEMGEGEIRHTDNLNQIHLRFRRKPSVHQQQQD